MAQYSIGEVEQLTGLKSYVLRYWEEVIPSVAPRKLPGGRRLYTQRELDVICRLKYLIYEKRFTIDGARRQVIQELDVADAKADALMAVRRARSELRELYMSLRHKREPQREAGHAKER